MDERHDPRFERTRRAVFHAVLDLIVEAGPEGVTHTAVATRARVGRATLYRHWPDRDQLIAEALAEQRAALAVELSGDFRTDVRALMRRVANLLRDSRSRRVLTTILHRAQWDPDVQRLRDHQFRDRPNPLVEVLERGQATGDIDPDLDVRVGIVLLAGPLLGRSLLQSEPIDDKFIDLVVDTFVRTHGR